MGREVGFRWWFYFVVPTLIAGLTLIAVELALRILWPVPHGIDRNMYFVSDPYTGYRIMPNSVGYFQEGIIARGNSHGHRDGEVSMEHREGVPRILVIGDSFTVGANVAEKDAYPQVLEQLLREALSMQVEVVNAGVGGWDPFAYSQYYEHYGRAFQPDLVLVGLFVGNDTYSGPADPKKQRTAVLGRRVTPEAAAKSGIALKVAMNEHSHLWRLVSGPVVTHGHPSFRRRNCEDFTERYLKIQRSRLKAHFKKRGPELEKALNRTVGHIQRIIDLADEAGVSVLVALLPDENQLNPALQKRLLNKEEETRYDFLMPQRDLSARLTAIGAKVIDLLPAFRADQRCLYMNDTHWTEEGHVLVAAELLPWVRASLTPQASNPSQR